jgi:small neutral amino acid transporter SnatA (MarC family)
LYCLAIILVSFSVFTSMYAYISLPRHLLPAMPVFIGLAAGLKKPWQRKTLIAVQIVGAIFLLILFVFAQLIP